jgi:hypothetical protein
MNNDVKYLENYTPDKLYVNPIDKGGKFVTLVDFEVSPRVKIAIQVFFVDEKKDISRFRVLKIRQEKGVWVDSGESVAISNFQLAKIKDFLKLLESIDLGTAEKAKLSLAKDIDVTSLAALFDTEAGYTLISQLSNQRLLKQDIFALAHKKEQLDIFEKLLNDFDNQKEKYISQFSIKQHGEEPIWQHFFEQNPWIFGHGLDYIFLDSAGKKLEAITTGATHDSNGKRVDGLMKTCAQISQYVLIEIKKPSDSLTQSKEHRPGCYAVSNEVSEAVTQLQKTLFEFMRDTSPKVEIKDDSGKSTGEYIYKVCPKSYLIIGKLEEVLNHDDRFICFSLFRESIKSPEIITYDELFERAKCIVSTLSFNADNEMQTPEEVLPTKGVTVARRST